MNERAWALASSHIERAAELGIDVHTLPGGARVIDAGVKLRADSPPAGRWPPCAWAGSGTWSTRP